MTKFKNQFPNFKPKFGNEAHIRILERMDEYHKLRSKYVETLEMKKQNVGMRKKCVEMKKKIREMIDFTEKTG